MDLEENYEETAVTFWREGLKLWREDPFSDSNSKLETRPYFRVKYAFFDTYSLARNPISSKDSDTHSLVKFPTSRKPWAGVVRCCCATVFLKIASQDIA